MSPLRDALRDLPDGVFFDLLESEEAYLVVLDVPGVSAETVDVALEEESVSIEARREKDLPEEYRYVEENRSLFFDASIPLPHDAADGADVEATVTHGVLELLVPRDESQTRTEIRDGREEIPGDADGADGTDDADPFDASTVEVGTDDTDEE